MDLASHILTGVLQKRGLRGHAESALVTHRAKEWIKKHAPTVASSIHVRTFRDGELFLECTHAIALQECAGFMRDLQHYIQSQCSFVKILHIKILRA